MQIDVKGLLLEGALLEKAEKDSKEAEKVGVLRGGNSGSLVQTDEGLRSIGGCARKALLRMLGTEVPDDEDYGSKSLMFALGLANEDSWATWLERSWTGQGKGMLLREEDVPTYWATRNGTPVTGRPDIVLAGADGTPQHGLELKQISSMWTARDVLQDKPKTAHVCQAAHYSMVLGVPFTLAYTSRVNFHVMGNQDQFSWVQRHFPRYGERHSDKCDYKLDDGKEATPEKVYKNGNVKPGRPAQPPSQQIFRVLPFVHTFTLSWEDEEDGTKRLWIAPSDLNFEEAARKTLVTDEGIEEYYETAANAVETDVLPPEPAALDVFGNEAKWRDCQYCPLQAVCVQVQEQGETSTQKWLGMVNAWAKEKVQE